LGCTRETVYAYLQRYPELQECRRSIVSTLSDFAESTVKIALKSRDMDATWKWLWQKHPEWTNKQIVEHMGTLNLTAGLMSKEEIRQLNNEDLQKLRTVRKAELAALCEHLEATVRLKVPMAPGCGCYGHVFCIRCERTLPVGSARVIRKLRASGSGLVRTWLNRAPSTSGPAARQD
jgi:hypothetical protein